VNAGVVDTPGMQTHAAFRSTGAEGPPGLEPNRRIAWAVMSVGALTGLVMGLWSFDGPVPVPGWLGEYGSTARRLVRLGHIACFGIGILNLLLVAEAEKKPSMTPGLRWASRCMNLGNIGLPLGLFAAAVVSPLKYAMAVPATAVTVALLLVACDTFRADTEGGGR
jgi:hypothetical protein